MHDPCERIIHKVVFCIMRHPCTFGFFFGICTVVVWWTCSRVTLASRSFQIDDMRIFPAGSYVNDIYNGSLEKLGKALQSNDLRFVAYYAPWCAQSRKMVPEMLNAAKILGDNYDFIAINCWVGTCKQNFSLHEFPKFFAYHSYYAPVEFLEPPETGRIVNFLQSVERPFYYIGNKETLQELMSSNEAMIIGYFNLNKKHNKRFSVFLELCISHANKVSRTSFGVVTNSKMAALVGFQEYGQIILRQILGEKRHFPTNLNFTRETIFSWISKHHTEFVTKLSPKMVDLDHYVSQLKRGPALLLFISQKRDSLGYSFRVLHQYRQTAAVYHNCSSDIILSGSTLAVNKEGLQPEKPDLCLSYRRSENEQFCDICHHAARSCVNIGKRFDLQAIMKRENYIDFTSINTNSCSCVHKKHYSDRGYVSVCCVKGQGLKVDAFKSISNYLEDVQIEKKRKNSEKEQDLGDLHSLNESKIAVDEALGDLVDAFKTLLDVVSNSSAEIASALQSKKHFKGAKFRREIQNANVIGYRALKRLRTKLKSEHNTKDERTVPEIPLPRNFTFADFNGLRCKTNKTVNFYYLDVENHKKLIRNLGIRTMRNNMVMTLVDVRNEATFVMNERFPITYDNIVNFITNYTNGRLERLLRSSDQIRECSGSETCIKEVTTATFTDIVLDSSKDVFLMYYAPWCGYCKPAHRVFLQLARLFRKIKRLQFARINADENELPYHLAVDGFPSFILFPMGRKDESRPYPDDLPIRLKEMENFLSNYTSAKTRTVLKSFSRNIT